MSTDMSLITRLTGNELAARLDANTPTTVWALEFPPGSIEGYAYTTTGGIPLADQDLREFAESQITRGCAHTLELVWSGTLLGTPWKFMRCPVDYLDDPTMPTHPHNENGSAFVRRNERKHCPCVWHGTMVFALRRDQSNRVHYPNAVPIDPATLAAATGAEPEDAEES